MKIAFFDSGIGGLTVLHEAMKRLPYEEYIYYADSANIPYGTKSSKEIKSLVSDAVKFLISKNIKALVLACNTATSVIVRELREKYTFPIIGMEPALKPALEVGSTKKILLCATTRTLKENKLKQLIETTYSSDRVIMKSLQPLVQHAENFRFSENEIKNYLSDTLKDVNEHDYESIVLGCTHFLFYRPIIQSIVGDSVKILDGNLGTVKRLESITELSESKTIKPIQYFSSKKELDSAYFEKYMNYYNSIQTLLF